MVDKNPLIQRVTDNQGNKTVVFSQNTAVTISISFVIAIITFVIYVVNGVDTMTNRVGSLEQSDSTQAQQITLLQTDNVTAKIQLSEIQAELKSIDGNILDIKQSLQK
jgi:hypothetical protein